MFPPQNKQILPRLALILSLALCALALLVPAYGASQPRHQAHLPTGPLTGIQSDLISLPNGDLADLYHPRLPVRLSRHYEDTLPLVILMQGALVDKSRYSEFGRQLAATGYVVVIPNHEQFVPDFGFALFTSVDVIDAVLEQMRIEDENPRSPLFRIIDTQRLGLVGHSYGGAVAINAAAGICERPFACTSDFERPPALNAVVVFGGSRPELEGDTTGVAVALLQGSLDGVAAPEKAEQTLPLLARPHALISIGGANHYGICNEDDPLADPSAPTLDQSAGITQLVDWTDLWLRANLGVD